MLFALAICVGLPRFYKIFQSKNMNKNIIHNISVFLDVASAFFAVFVLVGFLVGHSALGANYLTIIVFVLLAIQNHVFLKLARSKANPLLLFFCFSFIAFYYSRMFTALLFPVSKQCFLFAHPLSFDVSNLNVTLVFMFFANFAVALGVLLKPFKNEIPRERPSLEIPHLHSNIAIVSMIFLSLYSFMRLFKYTGSMKLLSDYLWLIGDSYLLLVLALVALFLFYNEFPKKRLIWLSVLILLYVVLQTLSGSRSGIYILAISTFFSTLSLHSKLKVRLKHILGFAVIFSVLGLVTFCVGSFSRYVKSSSSPILNSQDSLKRDYVRYADNNTNSKKNEFFRLFLLDKVFERLSYLEWSVDLIANKKEYSEIINPKYYFESIVDNVLSPGFTVFDAPRVSNSLRYIYYKDKMPKKSLAMVSKNYHSDILSIYGEYFVLFGPYLGVLVFFLSGWLFGFVYSLIRAKTSVEYYAYRGFLFMLFSFWINSFGMDWFAMDIARVLFFVVFLRMVLNLVERFCDKKAKVETIR
jgi:hypothetical protein